MADFGADVGARMRKVGEAAQRAQRTSVQRGAFVAKTVHLSALERDAPGGRLRNVGKNGARLSVRYTVRGGIADTTATVEAVGAWQILNNPAKPHTIKGRRGRILAMPDGGFRSVVHHPGHRGKHTWERAEPAAMRAATAELNKQMVLAVQAAFRG